MKKISVVTPCYNEEANVGVVYQRVKEVFGQLPDYQYEHIFADNFSSDRTLEILKSIASADKRVKIIANTRNFGPIRSVFNATLAASGDAIVILACDLQDDPALIPIFVKEWEDGYEVVFGIREKRDEWAPLASIRRIYYRLLNLLTDDNLVNDAGDFVLFDKKVLDILRHVNDLNPYIRGLLASLGFRQIGIPYSMGRRLAGVSKASLFNMFVYALNGFVNHTIMPLRLAILTGLGLAFCCFAYAFVLLIMKLFGSSNAPAGLTTVAVALFFLNGVQLFLFGFLGEFVASIYGQQKGLPRVIERERINF